jgi:hypothetical protein
MHQGRWTAPAGRLAYALKTPYRDGTTHVILEPRDFVARLAALVPGPRSHLTRYHGVFAPHARWLSRCERCGGPTRILASLSDPAVLARILTARNGAELPGPARGPP